MLSRPLADADTTLFTNPKDMANCTCSYYKACRQLDGTPLEK